MDKIKGLEKEKMFYKYGKIAWKKWIILANFNSSDWILKDTFNNKTFREFFLQEFRVVFVNLDLCILNINPFISTDFKIYLGAFISFEFMNNFRFCNLILVFLLIKESKTWYSHVRLMQTKTRTVRNKITTSINNY